MLKLALCGALALMSTSLIHAASCIINGSTERPGASISYEATPTLVMTPESDLGWGGLQGLDSWIWGLWCADPLWKFRSDPPSGFRVSIR